MDLLARLEERPLCGDGAMGTLLLERGVSQEACLEELCVSQPEIVSGIHGEYLEAGADFIRTNSFGANRVRLARFGLESHVNELNWQAAQLAKAAARGTGRLVAGSVGPLGISAEEASRQGIDREECFRDQIGALLDGGVNFIVFETFQTVEELSLALYAKQSLHHCAAICSLAVNPEGKLPDGTTLGDAFAALARNDAEILGINCVALETCPGLAKLDLDLPLAIFPSVNQGALPASPQNFAETGYALLSEDARIVGGCCGTTPDHIRALAALLAADAA